MVRTCKENLFELQITVDAIDQIHQVARGKPRTVNNIAIAGLIVTAGTPARTSSTTPSPGQLGHVIDLPGREGPLSATGRPPTPECGRVLCQAMIFKGTPHIRASRGHIRLWHLPPHPAPGAPPRRHDARRTPGYVKHLRQPEEASIPVLNHHGRQDFYRFSGQAMRAVILEGLDHITINVILTSPADHWDGPHAQDGAG